MKKSPRKILHIRLTAYVGVLLICVAAVLLFSGAARAATFTVTSGGDSGAGTLRTAVLAANADGTPSTIDISPEVKEIVLLTQVNVEGNITVNGGGAAIQGSGLTRLFGISKGQVKFSRLTFIGGGNSYSPENGGAAYIDSSAAAVTFENCTFFGNTGQDGGAVYVYGSGTNTTRFVNCTLTNNHAANNGGGVSVVGGNVHFDASVITGNSASSVADVYLSGGGLISNSGQYNVVNETNVSYSLLPAQHNDTGVSSSDVFATPVALSTAGGVRIVELVSSPRNKALDKIPQSDSLAFSLPAIDERGVARPQMNGIDAGAAELLPVALVSIDITGSSNLEINARATYEAKIGPNDATLNYAAGDGLVWSVATPSVISADQLGNVTALSIGETILTVAAHGWDANGNSVVRSADKRIKVREEASSKPVVGVSIKDIAIGADVKMTEGTHTNINAIAMITPEDTPYVLNFTTPNSAVAAVDEFAASGNIHSARVAARSQGEAIIRVTIDAENSKGKADQSSAYYFLTVGPKSSGGGGGGCSVGGGLLLWLPFALLIFRAKRRK
jgi:hypothetical protein